MPELSAAQKKSWLHHRLVQPLLALLRQGATPTQLAWSIALGVTLSCFPLFGATTALCTVAALALRLNLPATQLANYAASPLQLLLIVPFFRLGQLLFGGSGPPLSRASLIDALRAHPLAAARALWAWECHAIVAWSLIAPFAVLLLFLLLRPAMRALLKRSTP